MKKICPCNCQKLNAEEVYFLLHGGNCNTYARIVDDGLYRAIDIYIPEGNKKNGIGLEISHSCSCLYKEMQRFDILI
jgi:hypothetical protein